MRALVGCGFLLPLSQLLNRIVGTLSLSRQRGFSNNNVTGKATEPLVEYGNDIHSTEAIQKGAPPTRLSFRFILCHLLIFANYGAIDGMRIPQLHASRTARKKRARLHTECVSYSTVTHPTVQYKVLPLRRFVEDGVNICGLVGEHVP